MFKAKDFIHRKNAILEYFNNKEITEANIAEYCTLAGIPIVIVCEFIALEMPEHREMCINKIRDINEFFGIKEETCGICEVNCFEKHCITRRKK